MGRWEAPFVARVAVAASVVALWFAVEALTGLTSTTRFLIFLAAPFAIAAEFGFEQIWRRQPSDDEYPS
jgi:hypothetical protein